MTKDGIEQLVQRAVVANLDGCELLMSFTIDQLADGYNGIGPAFLPQAARDKISKYLDLFAPAALVHDMRYQESDGSRKGFNYANMEFRDNCLKLADFAYPWYSWRRYRARAVALALFDAVESPAGWLAWKPREGISTNKKED